MAINKVIFGNQTLMDTTGVTVTPNTMTRGTTALAANGETITGALDTAPLYNDLDKIDEGYALDARQGKVLNDKITGLGDPVTIAHGGTGASTASGARTNLNVYSKDEIEEKINLYSTIGPASIASFDDAIDDNAKDLVISVEPVQAGSGDPSPTNVRPISGWTGANVVVSPTTDAQDGTTYPISWQSVAGTIYGGTLDVTTGLLTVTMAEVDLGTLNWSSNTVNLFTAPINGAKLVNNATIGNGICSAYTIIKANDVANNNKTMSICLNGVSQVFVHDDSYTDAATFKTAISGVQLVYELATPQTYQLTPTQVSLLLGTNNVWANCGDIQSLTYRRADAYKINETIINSQLGFYIDNEGYICQK